MNCLVTGGAGFVGSNVTDRLLELGHNVTVYDNFSTGQRRFLELAIEHPNFKLVEGDLLDLPALKKAMQGVEFVFHFAANADVRFGTVHPRRDLEQNTIATFNVLDAMNSAGVKKIAFSSTGSIYGEPEVFPTPETCPFPVQTSLYGASKLAGEGMIASYCEGFNYQAWIFRFVSVLGERYSHGHVFDFYKKLLDNPNEILVMGDGHQKKSYIYIQDCIDAMFTCIEKSKQKVNVFNLGAPEYIEVNQSLKWICSALGLSPKVNYNGGERGWIGDSPFIFLETKKVQSLGWSAKFSIEKSIHRTLSYLQENRWLLEDRQ
jgi:UDP-glucose 4-epimerase